MYACILDDLGSKEQDRYAGKDTSNYIESKDRHVTGYIRSLDHSKSAPVLDIDGKKYNDKDAIEPGINIFQDSPQVKSSNADAEETLTSENAEVSKNNSPRERYIKKQKLSVNKIDERKGSSQTMKPTVRQGIGMGITPDGVIGSPVQSVAPVTLPVDPHFMEPAGLNVPGTQGTATPLRHTGKVALIPAILHKTEAHYDHDTGHFTPAETHVEPLIPAHDRPHQFTPHVNTEHFGINHEGGGMEHAFSMMEEPHAIDVDHGFHGNHGGMISPGMMHYPELHAPIDDHHDGHHDGHMPLIVHPHVDHVPPPPPPKKKKPDIIKVEFVPEDSDIKVAGKSVKGSKKAGTVKVQFIPGEGNGAQEATTRNIAPIIANAAQPGNVGSRRSSKNANDTSKQSSTEGIPTNILTSKLKDKLQGRAQEEVRSQICSSK